MGCDFKPGDELECVDDSVASCPASAHGGYWVPVVKGYSYTAAGLGVSRSGHPVVYLAEQANPHMLSGEDQGYWVGRFRKVERKTDKLSLTEWLSQPAGDTDRLDKTRPAKTRERA